MSLRGVNEIVVHLQSFRNIELWYQGLYFLAIELTYLPPGATKKIHAHPFAHTENFHPEESSTRKYDSQIMKPSYIDEGSSRFVSKTFLVKYYEQQVELNDICHFRIENSLSDSKVQLEMNISLMFVDLSDNKNFEKGERVLRNQPQEAKLIKTKKYHIMRAAEGVHQFVPVVFDQNYFSLVNASVHCICLDYRFRANQLQLSEFSKLTYNEKMKMIETNKKVSENGHKKISYYSSILSDLQLPDKPASLQRIESLLVMDMKYTYSSLLYSYSNLFSKVIKENEKKIYGNRIINPNALFLFEEPSQVLIGANQGVQQIYRRYRSRNPEQILQRMLNETNIISSQLVKLWHCYIDIFRINPRFAICCLQSDYQFKKKEFWTKLIHVNKVVGKDLCQSYTQDTRQIQKDLQTEKARTVLNINVQEDIFISRRHKLPTLIYNIHYREDDVRRGQPALSLMKEDMEGIHLIVFAHGFQGNSFDMKMIKNYVSFMYPESMFLCATSNEDLTDGDIFQMGERMATEVKQFIMENFPIGTLSKISFVGHSLGGLTIRAALPKLLQYRDKFHCYISFSSPHLGYGINTSSMIGAGMWFLQKMKNSVCLKQLTMTDQPQIEDTCLYQLSQSEGLQHFKNIFLFSSKQDSYAPYESARIQIDPSFLNDSSKQTHCAMVRNVMRDIQSGCLRRIDVTFDIGERSLDSFIGRTAHILFLENQELMKALIYTEPGLLA